MTVLRVYQNHYGLEDYMLSPERIEIPFSSFDNVMIVAVDGTGKNHPLGLRDVLFNFRYLCQANGSVAGINRPATRYIAFYVSGGPKAIVYLSIVERIFEKGDQRYYYLESISKLRHPIPLGKTPPYFSGGGIQLSLKDFMRLENVDEIYEHIIKK